MPNRQQFFAFVNSPKLELTIAVSSGLLSLLSTKDDFWKNVASLVTSTVAGGSVTFLIKLYLKLDRAVPTVQELTIITQKFDQITQDFRNQSEQQDNDFKKQCDELEERLLPSLYIPTGMKLFHEQWIDWHKSLALYGNTRELEKVAWTFLAEAYLGEEIKRIESKYVFTTTNCYTKLITDVSKHLEEREYLLNKNSPPKRNIIRYQITGMLPEEFYNGPQIEFIADNSQPIFFCHKWENYRDFYDQQYKGRNINSQVDVRRCILVRQPELRREELSALSTLADLREQKNLSIIDTERRVIDDLHCECESAQKRLFRKCSDEQQQNYTNLIGSILGRQQYRYWAIALTNEVNSNQSYNPLLNVFARAFHGEQPDKALFCTLSEKIWSNIEREKLLKDCFKTGWTPEIALFGELGSDGKPSKWDFGILGHWRPFTPDIELRFLNSKQTSDLYNAFINSIYEKSRFKGTLLSIMDPS